MNGLSNWQKSFIATGAMCIGVSITMLLSKSGPNAPRTVEKPADLAIGTEVGRIEGSVRDFYPIYEIRIKGHDYLVLRTGSGVSMLHAESCGCASKP